MHNKVMPTAFYKRLESPLGLAVMDLVDYYNEGLIITRINVPKAHRGKGIARELLAECLAKADELGVTLWLEIQESDGLSHDQLETWYKRNGFEGHGMYRRKPCPSQS